MIRVDNETSAALQVQATFTEAFGSYDCDDWDDHDETETFEVVVAPGSGWCFEGPVDDEEYDPRSLLELLEVRRDDVACLELGPTDRGEPWHEDPPRWTVRIDDETCP